MKDSIGMCVVHSSIINKDTEVTEKNSLKHHMNYNILNIHRMNLSKMMKCR